MMNSKELELKLSDALQREDTLKEQLAESHRALRAETTAHENTQMQLEKMAAELSAIDSIHDDAVFITDEHYEQCPPEVQKIIRSLAVLQIPAYKSFLAEVRAQIAEEALKIMGNFTSDECGDSVYIAVKEFAENLRKGVQS